MKLYRDELLSYVRFNEHKEQMFIALQENGGIRGFFKRHGVFLKILFVSVIQAFRLLKIIRSMKMFWILKYAITVSICARHR